MPIHTEWKNQAHGVIHLQFEGKWTIPELQAVGENIAVWLADRDTPGTVIIDLTSGSMLPERMVDHAAIFSRPSSTMLADVGLFVVVGSNRMGTMIFKSFTRIFKENTLAHRTTFVDTLPEALTLIAEHPQRAQES